MDLQLPENFFREEIRSGFKVTAYRKRCWAKMLNMLCVFDDFAQKYSIPYYLAYGSLLGAVRHQGFVPWDDDIDVIVKRDSYQYMQTCAREYFKERTDGIVYEDSTSENLLQQVYFSRLRDMNTTVAEPEMMEKGEFTGLFLDIFPLDAGAADDFDFSVRKELWLTVKSDPQIPYWYHNGFKFTMGREAIAQMWNLSFRDKMVIFDDYMCAAWGTNEKVGDVFEDLSSEGKKDSLLSDWGETVYLSFEGMEFPCPVGYGNILTASYGDYTECVRGKSLHEGSFMDPDTPCREYLKGRKTIPHNWRELM